MRLFLIFIFFVYSALTQAEKLVTPEYAFDISVNCEEGNVTCSKVSLVIFDLLKNTTKEAIKGKTWHTVCADGNAPCQFLGYKFVSGSMTYYIHQSGEVEMYVDKKLDPVYSSQGHWQ